MEIKVVVPEITLNTVIGEVVRFDEDGDPVPDGEITVGDKVAKIIANEVMRRPEYASLRERVVQIRTEEIREALRPVIAETLAGPIYMTNTYGERTGKETTFKELVMEEARKAWATSKNHHGSRQDTVPDLIAAEVRKQIGGEIAKAVKAAHDAALKAVGDVAAAPVVEAVRKALGK